MKNSQAKIHRMWGQPQKPMTKAQAKRLQRLMNEAWVKLVRANAKETIRDDS